MIKEKIKWSSGLLWQFNCFGLKLVTIVEQQKNLFFFLFINKQNKKWCKRLQQTIDFEALYRCSKKKCIKNTNSISFFIVKLPIYRLYSIFFSTKKSLFGQCHCAIALFTVKYNTVGIKSIFLFSNGAHQKNKLKQYLHYNSRDNCANHVVNSVQCNSISNTFLNYFSNGKIWKNATFCFSV